MFAPSRSPLDKAEAAPISIPGFGVDSVLATADVFIAIAALAELNRDIAARESECFIVNGRCAEWRVYEVRTSPVYLPAKCFLRIRWTEKRPLRRFFSEIYIQVA